MEVDTFKMLCAAQVLLKQAHENLAHAPGPKDQMEWVEICEEWLAAFQAWNGKGECPKNFQVPPEPDA